jgi:hypothetical protein
MMSGWWQFLLLIWIFSTVSWNPLGKRGFSRVELKWWAEAEAEAKAFR